MVRLAYTLTGDQGHAEHIAQAEFSSAYSACAVLASTAFVINGNVQSAPITAGPITIGKLMIAGTGTTNITKAEAEALAGQLS
jgi:hypothetical protein